MRSKTFIWFVPLGGILLFILGIKPANDPDLGWHLRNGMDILARGWVAYTDPYSWTMGNYPWIAHEWLQDIFMYLVNLVSGASGLSIIYAVLVAGAFLLASRCLMKVSWPVSIIVALLGGLACSSIMGPRAQVFMVLNLASLLFVLFRWKDGVKKAIYWLPLLFLFWVNTHGSFIIGLAVMGIFGIAEIVKHFIKRIQPDWVWFNDALSVPQIILLIKVGLISLLVTLINPYGYRIYEEIYNTMTNHYALSVIGEWQALNTANPAISNFLLFAVFLGIVVLFNWQKMDFTKVFLAVVFLVLSTTAIRHMSIFALVALPLVLESVYSVMGNRLNSVVRSPLTILGFLVLISFVGMTKMQYAIRLDMDKMAMAENGSYPLKAIDYLKSIGIAGKAKMFNGYNWGGYLVWNYPEDKVFIDGRMAIWKNNQMEIMKDHDKISSGSSEMKTLLESYDIGYILINRLSPMSALLENKDGETGWRLSYQDTNFQVLIRKDLLDDEGNLAI